MPDDADVVSAAAGSVVFVPGGHWHTTEVTSDHSVAIVLTVRPRSWCQLLLGELEKRLHAQLAISRTASLPARADRFAHNEDTLAELLAGLGDLVRSTSARSLLRDWAVAAHPVLSMPPGVHVELDEPPGAEWGLSVRQRDQQFVARIDRSLGTVLRTISGPARELSYGELCRALPDRDPAELANVVRELQQAGLVRATAPAWASA